MTETIKTNNQPRELITGLDLPAKILAGEFCYIRDDELYQLRFFECRYCWYDAFESMRIQPAGTPSGSFVTYVQPDNILADWDGVQSDSYFSAVVIKLLDDDEVIVGTYTC